MQASIFSKDLRSTGNDIITFDVDDGNFNKDSPRVVSRESALDGTVLLTDWGFAEGNRVISMSNLTFNSTQYDILVEIEEDNTNSFYFAYVDTLWKVVVQSINGRWNGQSYLTRISLNIVEKITPAYE